MAKPALGRGWGALLGGNPIAKPPQAPVFSAPTPAQPAQRAVESREGVQRVSLDRIRPSPFQRGKSFRRGVAGVGGFSERAGDCAALIVRERAGALELIAGERRWRAAQLAGLTEVPIIVEGSGRSGRARTGAESRICSAKISMPSKGTWLMRS